MAMSMYRPRGVGQYRAAGPVRSTKGLPGWARGFGEVLNKRNSIGKTYGTGSHGTGILNLVKAVTGRGRSKSAPSVLTPAQKRNFAKVARKINFTRETPSKRQRLSRRSSGSMAARARGRYFTTGRYLPPFLSTRKALGGKFAKKGAMMRTEKGGVVEQDKCVYIGHAAGAPAKVMRIVFMALTRKLLNVMGHHIKTFKEEYFDDDTTTTSANHSIRISWVPGDVGARRAVATTITSNQTVESIAENLLTAFITDFQAANTAAPFERFRLIEIKKVFSSTAAVELKTVNIPMSEMYVDLLVKSELTLQNRTLANSGANPEHHDSMLDVENNPIEGYKYSTVGTGFVMKWTNDLTAPHVAFVADEDSAVITGDPDNANLTAEEQDLLQRPPSNHAFQKCYRTRKVMLPPGGLKRNYLNLRKTYHINQLLRSCKNYLLGTTAERQYLGKSEMFAFEKMMHTTDITEPDMSIGYECNTFYAACVWYKTPRILVDKDVL